MTNQQQKGEKKIPYTFNNRMIKVSERKPTNLKLLLRSKDCPGQEQHNSSSDDRNQLIQQSWDLLMQVQFSSAKFSLGPSS